MRVLYLLALIALAGALLLGMVASDTWDAAQSTRMRNQNIVADLQHLTDEEAAMEKVEPLPLRFADEALAEFFSRTVEAGEVLGAGVRVQPRDEAAGLSMIFQEHRQGVRMCPIQLSAALETKGAAAILAMFEEELNDLPVAVRKIVAKNQSDTISLTMDVDVFGR